MQMWGGEEGAFFRKLLPPPVSYTHLTPLTQDKVRSLHIGDRVLISGTIYAARDAAHKRMVETLDRGEPLPCLLYTSRCV